MTVRACHDRYPQPLHRLALSTNSVAKAVVVALLFGAVGCGRIEDADAATRITRDGNMVTLTNGMTTARVDLAKGGSLVYLASANGPNLVNDHDLGRQVQASFYSGPKPYGQAAPAWKGWAWNPIQSGDVFNDAAQVSAWSVRDGTLYTRVVPFQWALRKVRCECVFETWTSLSGNRLRIRTRLTNRRSDHTQYPALSQELPAVYTVGRLRHLVSYTDQEPFAGKPVTHLPAVSPWTSWAPTEGWAAFVDDTGKGLGVISPVSQTFTGGFAGPARDGGEADDQTGYIAPLLTEVIDHNITYDSDATLVVGSIAEIRAAAREIVKADPRPDYVFGKDRQHWWYVNASDAGWPIRGALAVDTSHDDPQLWGPRGIFRAASVPTLYISAKVFGAGGTGQLFWSNAGDHEFTEAHSLQFAIVPDGKAHIYPLSLSRQPGWSGTINSLRFDPPGGARGSMQLCAISYRKRNCL